MLTVTEKAAHYLKQALTRRREGMPETLRIVYTDEGYQLTLDDPKEGDQVFEQDGQRYLLVGPEVSEALAEAIIDLQESPQGASLALTAARTPPAPEETEETTEGEPEPPSES